MRARWTLAHLLGFIRSWSGVVAMEKALGTEPMAALERALRTLWGPDGAERNVRWPLTVRVGKAGSRG
jgi:hypothetical protein